MGGSTYSSYDRMLRASTMGYDNASRATAHTIFTQTTKRQIHEEMNPSNIKSFRESRDSEVHPNTVPIQLYLDVTGSMGDIPIHLIKEGLPKMISTLIQKGVPDVALMFGAIGDHECDRFPLQIGQFESGDAELDMWLTRVYPEGGGGSNAGESYGLAWFNSANFIQTDAWDKRQEKGFVFTIGDEPSLVNYPGSMLKSLYGNNLQQTNSNYTLQELYESASEKNHIFHIHINHNGRTAPNLKQLMGQNFIEVNDHTLIPDVISTTVMNFESMKINKGSSNTQESKVDDHIIKKPKITL